MSINWTTYEYPGGLTNEERIAWFTERGFADYFSIWNTTTEGRFRLYNLGAKSGGQRVYAGMENMQNELNNDSFPYLEGCYAYLNSGSSAEWNRQIATISLYKKGSKIYFDKAIIGNVIIFKIRQMTQSYGEKSIIYVFDTKAVELATGNEVQFTYAGTPISYSSDQPKNNLQGYMMGIEGHTSPPKYYGDNGENIYIETDNYNTDKYIIRPFYIEGVKTNLWTIDGGQAHPSIYQTILVDGHEFYVLGQGLAVKVS